jgi:hypothetical protein
VVPDVAMHQEPLTKYTALSISDLGALGLQKMLGTSQTDCKERVWWSDQNVCGTLLYATWVNDLFVFLCIADC